MIAAKLHNDPLPYCHVVTSTTHKTLRGPRGGLILIGKDYENPFGQVAPKSGRIKMMSELIDSIVFPGMQGGPLMHVIAAKAVAFGENLQPSYVKYAEQIIKNAQTLASALIKRGYNIISGGTDNHSMLIDLRNKNLNGKESQEAMDIAGMSVNKNAVPFDDKSPLITSGIRIGTPAVTTRGMKEPEIEIIAGFIDRALSNHKDENILRQISKDVNKLCTKFPLYNELT